MNADNIDDNEALFKTFEIYFKKSLKKIPTKINI